MGCDLLLFSLFLLLSPTPTTQTHTHTHPVRRSCKFADVVELCGRHCIFGLTFTPHSPHSFFSTLLSFFYFFVSCRLQPIFMSPFCCCLLLLAHLIANIAHTHTDRTPPGVDNAKLLQFLLLFSCPSGNWALGVGGE